MVRVGISTSCRLVLFLLLGSMAKVGGRQILAAAPVFGMVSEARSLRRKEETLGRLGFSKSTQRREKSESLTFPPHLEAELALGD